ncbi:MAG: hypothetical protein ACRD29_25490 [Acidimicrobiales bacterium]
MPSDDVSANNPNLGISRRQLIKRGALVGGAVIWVTPVVQSFTSPAFAAQGSPRPGCPDGQQEAIGYVKWEVDEGRFEALTGGRLCIELAGACRAVSQHLAAHLNTMIDDVVESSSDEEVCIRLPDGCSMFTAAAAKEGRVCDTTFDGGDGVTSVCFVKERPGRGISNVQLGLQCCVPDDVIARCS